MKSHGKLIGVGILLLVVVACNLSANNNQKPTNTGGDKTEPKVLGTFTNRLKMVNKYVLVDTASLSQPAYYRFLRQRYPQRWPALAGEPALSDQLNPLTLVQIIGALSRTTEIYYLHPSFGDYFEYGFRRDASLVEDPFKSQPTLQLEFTTLVPWLIDVPEPDESFPKPRSFMTKISEFITKP